MSPRGAALSQRMQSHEPNACCECRSYGAQSAFVCVYPGFCSCLWHSRHPGLCRSVVPTALRMHLKFDALALVERSYLTNFCLVYIGLIKSIGCSRIILLQPMLFSAEGMGFEPMPPVTVLNAFQAFLFNLLSNLPSNSMNEPYILLKRKRVDCLHFLLACFALSLGLEPRTL